jgi:hypothetical protein
VPQTGHSCPRVVPQLMQNRAAVGLELPQFGQVPSTPIRYMFAAVPIGVQPAGAGVSAGSASVPPGAHEWLQVGNPEKRSDLGGQVGVNRESPTVCAG